MSRPPSDSQRTASAAAVIEHYGPASLTRRIQDALERAGLGTGIVSWEELAPLDQFHVRGLVASRELADAMSPVASASVLDVGCGVGGASRFLAATYGLNVTGIDLTPSFIEAAIMLSERAGLADRTRFAVADALNLPYNDASFDYVWTQHVAMNIRDRNRLYAEIHRVMKPGGLFAAHDVVQGDGGAIRFPVPWARENATSHLLSSGAMRETLMRSGFEIVSWSDSTAATRTWIERLLSQRSSASPPPPLGLGVITGPDLPVTIASLGRNIAENRAQVVQVIARA
jgi:ubiquinone/menaquinone biosynthesis C-methylase UbiE